MWDDNLPIEIGDCSVEMIDELFHKESTIQSRTQTANNSEETSPKRLNTAALLLDKNLFSTLWKEWMVKEGAQVPPSDEVFWDKDEIENIRGDKKICFLVQQLHEQTVTNKGVSILHNLCWHRPEKPSRF